MNSLILSSILIFGSIVLLLNWGLNNAYPQ
jgi:hypothetical protein